MEYHSKKDMKRDAMETKIFISYSSNNIGMVDLVVNDLLHHKHTNIFFDKESIRPGDEYEKVISDAIKTCNIFIVFYSESAAKSECVQKEIRKAFELKKYIIPILLDSTKPTVLLAKCQCLNFYDTDKKASEMNRLHRCIDDHIKCKRPMIEKFLDRYL